MQINKLSQSNSTSFNGFLTIKKQTNMLQSIYQIKHLRTKELQEVTLNTDSIVSVESLIKHKAVPALRDNILINMVNGIKYKITGCAKDSIFMEKWKNAHLNNIEECLYL